MVLVFIRSNFALWLISLMWNRQSGEDQYDGLCMWSFVIAIWIDLEYFKWTGKNTSFRIMVEFEIQKDRGQDLLFTCLHQALLVPTHWQLVQRQSAYRESRITYSGFKWSKARCRWAYQYLEHCIDMLQRTNGNFKIAICIVITWNMIVNPS